MSVKEERAEQVAELFKSVVEIAPEDRQTFLEERSRSCPEVRAEIESLLEVHDRAGRFMERPALELAAESFALEGAFRAGQNIGHYEIVSLIGKGGMGEVYLAQDQQLRRRVALKLVRRGMDTEAIVRRFHHEQQLLAGLNHPNIAQLYDSGITSDGIPFFAMEYVDGTRVDAYCREKELPIEARLELFAKVCGAVHYAHQHLVVHRDIKPSNILVTAEGEPKLLDFGIAKLLDTVTSDAPEQTVTLQNVLTPQYASPEHVRGEAITTASDVYSLGVLLYELLTGSKPYKIDSRTPVEVARVVTESAPPKPSTAVEGGNSGNPRFTFYDSRALRGDLDNIVLLAMRKEPQRRYSSCAQFSSDIRRHLDGLPVVARKDTVAYRGSKFVRRHRVGVAAAGLVLLTLAGGIVATLVQARRAEEQRARAEKRFNDVRALANSLLFEIMPKFMYSPGTSEAREIATKRALEYLDGLAGEAGGDPALQHELAVAYRTLTEVTENATGDAKEGLKSRSKSLALQEALLKNSPNDPRVRDETAKEYEGFGWSLWLSGDSGAALKSYEKAIALREPLLASAPQSFDFCFRLAHLHMSIGDLFNSDDDPREALGHYRAAMTLMDSLRQHKDEPGNRLRLQRGIIYCYCGLAEALWRGDDWTGAMHEYDNAAAIVEPIYASSPNDLVAWTLLGQTYSGQAKVYGKQQDHIHAEEKLRRCLGIWETASQRDALIRSSLASTYSDLGAVVYESGDVARAVEHLEKAIPMQEELLAGAVKNRGYNADLATSYERMGVAQRKLGNYETALENYGRAVPLRLQNATGTNSAGSQKELASCYGDIGLLHTDIASAKAAPGEDKMAHWREARAQYARSLEIFQRLHEQYPERASFAAKLDEVGNYIRACDHALANR